MPLCQAIMFWVVDNFLMRKRKKLKDNPGNGQKPQARYFKLKSMPGKDNGRTPEAEVLLSQDEDSSETVVLTSSQRANETCIGRNVSIL